MRERDAVSNEEFYLRNDKAKVKAGAIALATALAYQVEISNCVHKDIPQIFGNKWAVFFQRTRARLAEEYEDKLESLCLLAFRSYVYACHNAAAYMAEMFEGSGGVQNSTQECLVTADGYADHEGWAYTLYNELANIHKPTGLLQGAAFDEFPPDAAVLEAMAVIWFFEAALISPNDGKSMDVLFEAIDAAYLAHGVRMWNESEELCKSENSQAAPNPAAEMAKMRHVENYALANYALKYWHEKIDPALSAEKAATELTRVVPLSHKKLAAIISAERKKLR